MTTPSQPGAFLQLIDYTTDQPDQMHRILDRWPRSFMTLLPDLGISVMDLPWRRFGFRA